MDEKGEVRRFVNVYVNEEDIRFLKNQRDAAQRRRRNQHHPRHRRRLKCCRVKALKRSNRKS